MMQYFPKTSTVRAWALVLIAIAVSGCELFGSDSGERDELSLQRAIWQSFNSGSYSFVLTRGCFCVYAGEFEIFVEDNELVDIVPAWDDLEGVPREDWDLFPTIDGVFDILRSAYMGDADQIVVEYSNHGYPISADIDYIEQAIDDELYLGVADVRMVID